MDTGLVIFDLDGTLLNTIGDLAVACNAVLAMRGLPQHTYDEYCHFVGNGIMRLVERALPEELRTPYTVAAVRADFVKYYTEHIDVYTKPYEGIPELVAEIARRGVRIAVASNKFQTGTEKLIRLFFPGVEFAAVFGQRDPEQHPPFFVQEPDGQRQQHGVGESPEPDDEQVRMRDFPDAVRGRQRGIEGQRQQQVDRRPE